MEYDTEARAKWWRQAIKSGKKTEHDLSVWLKSQQWSLRNRARFLAAYEKRSVPPWHIWYGFDKDKLDTL